ncbi:MAG: hypothetical protein C6Y22_26105 [Hapalosiphonaceae cyanobacterium JJU2]|nr:MAG: hypothetical protein C6Y22_26105 [Hapalosiphonaceae cyanobacterium JJU2]
MVLLLFEFDENAIAPRSPTFIKSRGSFLEYQVQNLKFHVSGSTAITWCLSVLVVNKISF